LWMGVGVRKLLQKRWGRVGYGVKRMRCRKGMLEASGYFTS